MIDAHNELYCLRMNQDELQRLMIESTETTAHLFAQALDSALEHVGIFNVSHYESLDRNPLDVYIISIYNEAVWHVQLKFDHEKDEIILISEPIIPAT